MSERRKSFFTLHDIGEFEKPTLENQKVPKKHLDEHGRLQLDEEEYDRAYQLVETDGVGRWSLVDLISKRTFGSVFKAEDNKLGPVAIKVSNEPQFDIDLEREAKLLANLRHHNLPRVYDFGYEQPDDLDAEIMPVLNNLADRKIAFYVMELLEKPDYIDMHDAIHREELLNEYSMEQKLEYIRQLAEVIEYLQENHVLHYDLKPLNIKIPAPDSDEKYLKLLDFGTANSNPSETGAIMGTPEFTPLSSFIDEAPIRDIKNENYALGLIALEFICNIKSSEITIEYQGVYQIHENKLKNNINAWCLANKIQNRQEIISVFLKALHNDPNERFDSPSEFYSAIEDALDEKTVHNIDIEY